MKRFLIGLIVGILIVTTGVYAYVEKRVKKVATKQNVEKVTKAVENAEKALEKAFK